MLPPVLIILHKENSTPGRIGNALRDLGFSLDIRRPRFGDPLPETMAGHAGAVIFGGPMSANDKEDYIRREIEWIKVPLERASRISGSVSAHRCWRPVRRQSLVPSRRAGRDRLLSDLSDRSWPANFRSLAEHVYQWHREGFDLPAGGELIATGDTFPTQAFRYGSGYGLQFHPDVTHAMMCRWTTRGHERMQLPGAKSRVDHFADRAVHDLAARGWLASFLQHWLACGTGRCAVTSADHRADRL